MTIPVAAHALGLIPERLATAHTTLPLCNTPLYAAVYCTAFLSANLLLGLYTVAASTRPQRFWATHENQEEDCETM